jgi:UDP-3-O-[3-hydroxymyristoyl] glucosamine N-acyltransferase
VSEEEMELTAEQVAQVVNGEVVGDPGRTISGIADLSSAASEDLACAPPRTQPETLQDCEAGIFLLRERIEGCAGTMVICENTALGFSKLLEIFARERLRHPKGVSPEASIDPTASIGREVAIGACAVISAGVEIGDDTIIYPGVYLGPNCRVGRSTIVYANVSLHQDTIVGSNCIIHYGCVIGADGFGFTQHAGKHVKRQHIGSVRIGNDVELGALTTIDRGMLDETVIEDGFKCDDHVHIGHNCHIGEHSLLTAGCLVGGSTKFGKGVMVAADCVFRDHISVGDGARIGACSALSSDAEPNAILLGAPARPMRHQMRIIASTDKLPEMARRLRELENKVENMASQLPLDREDS